MAGRPAGPGGVAGDSYNDGRAAGAPDQRRARGLRTRARLIQAMIDLIESGIPQPTTVQVASRAGNAVRTIFDHFEDIDDLFCQAAELKASRHRAVVGRIPPHGPVGNRIRATSHQRRQHYEEVGPVLRVAYGRNPGSPGLGTVLANHRRVLRHHLSYTFGPELAARGPEARFVLETVDLTTGWQNWNALRIDAGHSAVAAEEIVVFAVTAMLRC